MDRDVQAALYDRLLPGWRDAPVKGGERHLKCPLHDDSNPSLRLNEAKLTWYCDPCAVGGGAYHLAVKVLDEHEAKELLEELNPSRTYEVEVLGEVPEPVMEAFERDRRIMRPGTLQEVGARLVRARFFDSETQEWKAWHQYVGFPATTKGTWKLWGLNHDHRVGWKVSAGKHDLHLSPTLASFSGTEIPRLWDTEGESDWLAAIEAGLPYVLTPSGGASSTKGHDCHRERLTQLPIQEVCVEGDLDKAGHEGSAKRAEWWRRLGFPARIVELPKELGEKGDLRDYLNGRPAQNGSAGKEPMGDAAALESLADRSELLPALESSGPESQPADEDERIFQDLAQLPRVEYDRRREEAAKQLRIRVPTLDAEVEKRRPRIAADPEQSTFPFAEQPEPWDEPVKLRTVLNSICTLLKRFVALPTGAYATVSLWIVHSWAHDAFWISPLLALVSPEKRCGKTTLLSLLQRIVPRALAVSNITPASLFRVVEKHRPTLLVDEADSFLKDNEELRGIVNSGHYRSTAKVIRTVGDDHEPTVFCTWGPKAIAAIGALAPTLEDRSITIPMRRRRPDETVERLRGDRDPGFGDLARQVRRWVDDNLDALKAADPEVPESLHDRAADNWRSLLAIADAAGGQWPEIARTAAVTLTSQEDESSAGILLLFDMREIFAGRAVSKIFSNDLREALVGLEARPWSEWRRDKPITANGVARLLKVFGIRPHSIRIDSKTAKGYELNDFEDAFARYLQDPPSATVTPSQVNEIKDLGDHTTVTRAENVTVGNAENFNEIAGCDGVTVGNPPERGLDKKHPEEPSQDRLPLWPEEPGEEVDAGQAPDAGEEIVL